MRPLYGREYPVILKDALYMKQSVPATERKDKTQNMERENIPQRRIVHEARHYVLDRVLRRLVRKTEADKITVGREIALYLAPMIFAN